MHIKRLACSAQAGGCGGFGKGNFTALFKYDLFSSLAHLVPAAKFLVSVNNVCRLTMRCDSCAVMWRLSRIGVAAAALHRRSIEDYEKTLDV